MFGELAYTLIKTGMIKYVLCFHLCTSESTNNVTGRPTLQNSAISSLIRGGTSYEKLRAKKIGRKTPEKIAVVRLFQTPVSPAHFFWAHAFLPSY